MSYTNLVDSNLRRAFNLVKDLASIATFNVTQSQDFNFNTGKPAAVVGKSIETKVVVTDGLKSNKDSNSIVKQLLVKAKEVGDIKAFGSVTFEGKEWKISSVIKGTGFIYVIDVSRES